VDTLRSRLTGSNKDRAALRSSQAFSRSSRPGGWSIARLPVRPGCRPVRSRLVAQRSINVAVTVFRPDGTRLVDTDATGIASPRRFVHHRGSGVYRAQVRAADTTAPGGTYRITLEDVKPRPVGIRILSPPREPSARRWRCTTSSRRLDASSHQKLEVSLVDWRAAKDGAGEARHCLSSPAVHRPRRQAKALDFTTCAAGGAEAGDRVAEAWALDFIGQANENFGDRNKLSSITTRRSTLRRSTADRGGRGQHAQQHRDGVRAPGREAEALGYFEDAARFTDVHDRGKKRRSVETSASPIRSGHLSTSARVAPPEHCDSPQADQPHG